MARSGSHTSGAADSAKLSPLSRVANPGVSLGNSDGLSHWQGSWSTAGGVAGRMLCDRWGAGVLLDSGDAGLLVGSSDAGVLGLCSVLLSFVFTRDMVVGGSSVSFGCLAGSSILEQKIRLRRGRYTADCGQHDEQGQ